MKKVIVSLVLALLCTHLSAMEIEGKTKSDSERTPLKKNMVISQKQTRNSSCGVLSMKKSSTYGAYMEQLPQDVNAIIYQFLFETNKNCAKEFAQRPATILIRHFLQDIRPVVLGNKKFGIVDMLRLSQKQRDDFMKMAEPYFIDRLYGISNQVIDGRRWEDRKYSDYEKLKAMPSHITSDLEISMMGRMEGVTTGWIRCLGFGVAGIGALISCIACLGTCDLLAAPCISKPVAMIMAKVSGGLVGSPIAGECINCMRIHYCCPCHEECEFSEDNKNGKIN
jgi:hypothetical protein